MLEKYIQARREEAEGRYSEALEIYTSMNFLDSLERSVSLVGGNKEQQYTEAHDYFSKGMFAQAAKLFEQLGRYKDSQHMAELARSSIRIISTQDMEKLNCIDSSNVSIWGNGNFMDMYGDVMFGINVEINELQDPLELIELSWTNDFEPFADLSGNEWGQKIIDGITIAHCDEMDYGVYGEDRKSKFIEIALPDKKELEGEQIISFSCCNVRIDLKVRLTYIGSYTDNSTVTGWDCEYISREISEIKTE